MKQVVDNKAREFRKSFLIDRDHTGRELITYFETGKTYFIEWIQGRTRTKGWGDQNPSTGKIEGSYGEKFAGAIKEEESMITKENGFKEIKLGTGSPYHTIDKMHEKWKAENGY